MGLDVIEHPIHKEYVLFEADGDLRSIAHIVFYFTGHGLVGIVFCRGSYIHVYC